MSDLDANECHQEVTPPSLKDSRTEKWVKYCVIDSKQNPILSGKACQALNLVQRVHQLDKDLKELLDRPPGLENASGAMPGTYSIKIDPTASQ